MIKIINKEEVIFEKFKFDKEQIKQSLINYSLIIEDQLLSQC